MAQAFSSGWESWIAQVQGMLNAANQLNETDFETLLN
jgi:hypothetical protein